MSIPRKSSDSVSTGSQKENGVGCPDVVVEFLFDRGLLFISVRNIGARPATKISVKFDKKMIGLGGTKDISDLALFNNIEFLGPGREIITLLDASNSYFRRKQPTKISARVSYTDVEKRNYEVTINHDLEIYRELPYLASPGANATDPDCLK